MVGLLLPNLHTGIQWLYEQEAINFYSPQKLSSTGGCSPTLCQTDYQNVRDGWEREAVGSVSTLDPCDANDHTGSRQRAAAGASGAT